MKTKEIVKIARKFAKNHQRGLLTATTIIGELIAIVMAAKEGPKYKEIIDEYNSRKGTDDAMSAGEVVKELAGPTLKIALPAFLSIGSAGMNHHLTTQAIGSLGTLLGASHAIQSEYEHVVKEVVGEEKAKEIEERVVSSGKPVMKPRACKETYMIDTIIPTGHGNDVFLDKWTGRKFYSDINYVKKVVNDLNYQLANDLWISLNEFYQAMGIPDADCGDELGWNFDYGQIDVMYYPEMDDSDKPYTAMGFRSTPCNKWERRNW